MEDEEVGGKVEKSSDVIVKFIWTINNFSERFKHFDWKKRLCSPEFFPVDSSDPWFIELHLVHIEETGEHKYYLMPYLLGPSYQTAECNCKLLLINQVDEKKSKTEDPLIFEERLELKSFLDPNNGYVVNDTCIVVVKVPLNENNASFDSKLIDLKGVGKIEKDYFELLEKACSKHPSLIESFVKKNRSQSFIECGFTALGRVLHFLKTKKLKDMINDDDACKKLQDLWDEVGVFGFDDLTWLEPHVRIALSMKDYVEKEEMVTKLKGDVVDLEERVKKAKEELAIAEEGFVKRDLNDELGHGIP